MSGSVNYKALYLTYIHNFKLAKPRPNYHPLPCFSLYLITSPVITMFYTLHFLSFINKFFYSFIFIRFPARHLINFPAKPVKSGTQSLINILFERQPREERNNLFCAWPRRIINNNFGVFKIYINTPKAGLGRAVERAGERSIVCAT